MRSERPRGQLFSDPAAAAVWAGICALDEGIQHEVLVELRERLGDPDERDGPLARKVARGVGDLRRAAKELSRSPSVRAYRELKNERPDLNLSSDGSIRSWLGGDWNSALERAGLDRVPDSDADVAPLGPKLTRDELLEAARTCAAELGHPPGLHHYLNWARCPDVRCRPGRRATSQGPFDREFGGWPATLVAAGLIEEGDTRRAPGGRPRAYTDAQLFEFLAELRDRLGAFPTSNRLSSEREEIKRELEAAGQPPRDLPSYGVYFQRFGSWANVRAAFDRWEAEGRPQ